MADAFRNQTVPSSRVELPASPSEQRASFVDDISHSYANTIHDAQRESQDIDGGPILSLMVSNLMLGAALWTPGSRGGDALFGLITLFCDAPDDATHHHRLRVILDHAHPQLILLPARCQTQVEPVIRSWRASASSSDVNGAQVQTPATMDFGLEAGRIRIQSIVFRPGPLDAVENSLSEWDSSPEAGGSQNVGVKGQQALQAMAQGDSHPLMTSATGALLLHLQRRHLVDPQHPNCHLRIGHPAAFMHVPPETVRALALMMDESGSGHSRSRGADTKPRSIFQLVNHTLTPLGRERLLNWFRLPLRQHQTLCHRQATQAYLLQPPSHACDAELRVDAVRDGLIGVPHVPTLLRHLETRLYLPDWIALIRCLGQFTSIGEVLQRTCDVQDAVRSVSVSDNYDISMFTDDAPNDEDTDLSRQLQDQTPIIIRQIQTLLHMPITAQGIFTPSQSEFQGCGSPLNDMINSGDNSDPSVLPTVPFHNRIEQLASLLEKTIAVDASRFHHRVVVQDGVDATLDELRLTYSGLDNYLASVALEVRQALPTLAAILQEHEHRYNSVRQNCLGKRRRELEASMVSFRRGRDDSFEEIDSSSLDVVTDDGLQGHGGHGKTDEVDAIVEFDDHTSHSSSVSSSRSIRTTGTAVTTLTNTTGTVIGRHADPHTMNVVYFPQLGFHIALPFSSITPDQTPRSTVASGSPSAATAAETTLDTITEARLAALGLTYRFASPSAHYYKHAIMTRLDETLGDIYTRIVDRELDLLQSVREDVLHYGAAMTALADRLADLDALASMAHTARILGWVRPHLTRTRGIHIEDGRHPLVEMACQGDFIPNDIHLAPTPRDALAVHSDLTEEATKASHDRGGSAFRRPHRAGEGILLTGPNSSGKSVYVKQTGVIVFLSHIGSYVPARRARIGMVDHLMTRLQTSESVSRPESAFVIDVRQVAHALQIATPRSLLLMDEFGKGTDAGNGISLFCGVLKYLLNFPKRGDDPSVHDADDDAARVDRRQSNTGVEPGDVADEHVRMAAPAMETEQAPENVVPARRSPISVRQLPFFIMTTHYTEIYRYALLPLPHPCLQEYATQVIQHVPSDPQEGVVPTRIDSLSATMVPQFTLLYAVKPGRSSVSWGLACAQVAGIPPGILRLARWAHARLVNEQPLIGYHEHYDNDDMDSEQTNDEGYIQRQRCRRHGRRRNDRDSPATTSWSWSSSSSTSSSSALSSCSSPSSSLSTSASESLAIGMRRRQARGQAGGQVVAHTGAQARAPADYNHKGHAFSSELRRKSIQACVRAFETTTFTNPTADPRADPVENMWRLLDLLGD